MKKINAFFGAILVISLTSAHLATAGEGGGLAGNGGTKRAISRSSAIDVREGHETISGGGATN